MFNAQVAICRCRRRDAAALPTLGGEAQAHLWRRRLTIHPPAMSARALASRVRQLGARVGAGPGGSADAAAALAANLDAMGFFPTTHAVLGAMADKDLALMLTRLGPLVDRWYFTDLPTPRAASAEQLLARWEALPGRRADVPASTHASPQAALDAAMLVTDPADRIVVFGSFYTVGGVLKDGVPRLQAKHIGS